jgi:hypothetical protein
MPRSRPVPRSDADPSEPLYSVERANRTLPYVSRIAGDLRRDYARWRARVRAIEATNAGATAPLPDETQRRLQRETQELAADIQSALLELTRLGLECKSLEEGLIDFPAVVDGAPAYLCWKPGEPAVDWWHPRDAGFGGRQPLDGAVVAEAMTGADLAEGA